MKGVIYLRGVNNCVIKNNNFEGNNDFPIFSDYQEVGLAYKDRKVRYGYT